MRADKIEWFLLNQFSYRRCARSIICNTLEVDQVMEQAKNAGAVIVKPAQNTFWGGYAGYFQDPNGHLREIAWNPQWSISQ
jgi:uncharacterized protein